MVLQVNKFSNLLLLNACENTIKTDENKELISIIYIMIKISRNLILQGNTISTNF